jgi:hypothetical protein
VCEQQIPFGDERKKSKCKRRVPGMTERKARAKEGSGNDRKKEARAKAGRR